MGAERAGLAHFACHRGQQVRQGKRVRPLPAEAKLLRAASISPDRFLVAVAAIALVATIMTASYIFSFATITEAGEWTGAPEWAYPLAAVFIDGPIIAYTVTYSIWRFRGESPTRSLVFLYVFTSISTVVNVAHSLAFNEYAFGRPETYFGSVIAAAAPLGALLASEEVIRLVLRRPPERQAGSPTLDDGVPPSAELPAPPVAVDTAFDAPPPPSAERPCAAVAEEDRLLPGDADAPFDPDHDLVPDETSTAVEESVWSELSFDDVPVLDVAPERQVHA
ncbi:DUF2637 domain-containing protein [Curtobacterium sp. 20TX0008]|uniref:DUF2637 domain-containing protein n=1 Tax=Curtobacterium sp. 20TX0008 TaxID=3022018 RepID=UPI00232A934B|nr:DUF2637 domain-containing protein [Curtobacterium sp. 20TX0008]MDB6425882.1 DUF2637 domain-containing protein [Curtobacterium sp. 20TX0008]